MRTFATIAFGFIIGLIFSAWRSPGSTAANLRAMVPGTNRGGGGLEE
jgi:hypothetical protein